MKTFGLIIFSLITGLLIGGMGTRQDLAKAKQEAKDAKELWEHSRKLSGKSEIKNVTGLLGIAGASQGNKAVRAKAKAKKSSESTEETDVKVVQEQEDVALKEAEAVAARGSSSVDELEEAIELWKIRSDIARSTFVSNAKLSEEDVLDFDVLMAAMNLRLGESIEAWAEVIEGKENVGAEDGIRLMNEITDVMVLTYDEMDRKMPSDWRESTDNDLRIMDFIDPDVTRPLLNIEGKIDEIEMKSDVSE